MKVAYKWRLDTNNYSYIIDDNGGDPFISDGSNINEGEIKKSAGELSKDEYKDRFEKMLTIVKNSGFNINFLRWYYYYDLSNDTCIYREGNGGSFDGNITARVNSVTTGKTADVDITINGNQLIFDFVVVNGKDGKNGENGLNGKDGKDGKNGENGVGVPTGGTDGQVLVKDGSSDYSTKWADINVEKIDLSDYYTKDELNDKLIPTGGTDGQVLVKDGSGDYSTKWADINVESKLEGEYLPITGGTLTGDLSVSGTVTSSGGFFDNSDERLKNIIGKANLDIEKILNLSIVYFTFKNDVNRKQQIGVIAQEIAKICPEIVNKDSDGYLSVDYSKLSLLCLYCIKDLYNKIK